MRKCNVCGRRFRLLAKNRYEVVKNPVGLSCLTQGSVYFNAFDCPYCGCQNLVGIFEKENVKDMEHNSIKTVTNAEEAETYPISEDISKGFEEFTKMMFKQEQTESEGKIK